MQIDVTSWWLVLSIFSVINIFLFAFSAIIFHKRKHSIDKDIDRRRQLVLWCAGIYTVICAYRSFLPRIDLERICLVDTFYSNVFLGRSFTTVAEILFMLQCAVILHEAAKGLHDETARNISTWLVPLIVLAEIFSWYAMLSTNNLGSVIEESIWTLCGILIVISLVRLWPCVTKYHRKFLFLMIMFTAGYILFMVTIDVPMYWYRWQQDSAADVAYFNILDGLVDSVRVCTVTDSPAIWTIEMPWMTLYFTVAVWVSIALPHMPDYRLYRRKKELNKSPKR